MVGPWTDSVICSNQPFGQHIVVRCSGCGSRHSTKNIGWRNEKTNIVHLARTLFDIFGEYCTCKNSAEYPLVHDCVVDDIHMNWKTQKFEPGVSR